MRASLCSILLLLAGCSHPNVFDTHNQVGWVKDALDRAVDFWSHHDEDFYYADGFGVKVITDDLPDNRLGVYSNSVITLNQDLENRSGDDVTMSKLTQSCTVAHEIGHCLGLVHVENGAHLMSPVIYFTYDSSGNMVCPWSQEDQDDLNDAIARGQVCE